MNDVAGPVNFFSTGGTGDSIFKENTVPYQNIEPKIVEAVTLSEYVERREIPKPEFIKLDTQGAELSILKGAGSVLQSVKYIYRQAPVVCYNDGAPTF